MQAVRGGRKRNFSVCTREHTIYSHCITHTCTDCVLLVLIPTGHCVLMCVVRWCEYVVISGQFESLPGNF